MDVLGDEGGSRAVPRYKSDGPGSMTKGEIAHGLASVARRHFFCSSSLLLCAVCH